jgi:hypothetical protein
MLRKISAGPTTAAMCSRRVKRAWQAGAYKN